MLYPTVMEAQHRVEAASGPRLDAGAAHLVYNVRVHPVPAHLLRHAPERRPIYLSLAIVRRGLRGPPHDHAIRWVAAVDQPLAEVRVLEVCADHQLARVGEGLASSELGLGRSSLIPPLQYAP